MAKVSHQMQIDVPVSLLVEHPTIEELAAALEPAHGKASKPANQLLRLKVGGAKTIFFVHDADGEVLLYRTLAQRLPAAFSVFGVLPRSRPNIPLLGRTIEEIAASYLQEVRKFQPHGTYYLAGLCAGGVIAFEMATQLESAGERVGLVAIMDAVEPLALPKTLLNTRRRLMRLISLFAVPGPDLKNGERGIFYLRAILAGIRKTLYAARYEISTLAGRCFTAARLAMLKLVLHYDFSWPEFVPSLTKRQIYLHALKSYKTKILRCSRAAVITASEVEDSDELMIRRPGDPTLGWRRVAGSDIQVIKAQGGHSSMLQTPCVYALAEQFTSLLEDACRNDMGQRADAVPMQCDGQRMEMREECA